VMNASTRVGTAVSITLHNLQGQGYAPDNTTASGLDWVGFIAPGSPLALRSVSNTVTTTATSGGATGSASWLGWTQPMTTQYALASGLLATESANSTSLLGGCGTGPLLGLYGTPVRTCAPGSTFTVAFSIDDAIDANQFTTVFIEAYNGQGASACFTNPADGFSPGYSACGVYAESITNDSAVTPEPVTMVLMATGLFGVGGVGLRRKKRPPA